MSFIERKIADQDCTLCKGSGRLVLSWSTDPVSGPEPELEECDCYSVVLQAMKFRKKPVVIEAVQLSRSNLDQVKTWSGGRIWSRAPMRMVTGIEVRTLESGEGYHQAELGDWIIKGVKGEFYPCKPDIFQQTYEPAE